LYTVAFGLGVIVVVLLLFYGFASILPGRWAERGKVMVFLVPALFLIFIGLLVPAGRTIFRSFYIDHDIPKFGWFANYAEIFRTRDTRLTVINNLTWVVVGTVATTVLALAIARFADGMKNEKIAKSLIFIPAAISLAGAGIIWRFVYASPPFKVGLMSAITKSIPGLPASCGGDGDRIWLLERGFCGVDPPLSTAPGFNTFLLIIVFIWASAGISTVILSAAIKGVPDSLIEAARVDGATNRQVFYKVTLPYIRATVVTVATLTTIAALKAFDIVASMTGGNFGTSTLANDFYNTIFLQRREGLGSAMAGLIFLLVIPVVVINRRSQRGSEELMGA